MDTIIEWITRHWVTTVILLGIIWAVAFVLYHRKSLFLKE